MVIGTAGCNATSTQDSTRKAQSTGNVFPASQTEALLADVTKKTPKALPTTRLAEGLLPPTNRWFSGLAFGDQPQPVFPLPLSFGLTDKGFSFGLPTVTASEKAILGGFKPDVAVETGAASAEISAYDTLTVTIDSLDGAGKVLGKTTIAQGSPYVRYTAETGGDVQTKLPLVKSGDFWTAKAGETAYGLVVTDGSVQVGPTAVRSSSTRAAPRRGSSYPPMVPRRSWPNWPPTRSSAARSATRSTVSR